ncbi:unnamed protein product [Ambrosiozyma monospora]|uniref:Unnamed protein product n=1 Tax=Ambrosiozyma monospora TaxID=43982 RepID=A0ACB5SXN2_AMBMO|nr:unnamed protein product [Ambrosiozyma monospora]
MAGTGIWNDLLKSVSQTQSQQTAESTNTTTTEATILLLGGSAQTHQSIIQNFKLKSQTSESTKNDKRKSLNLTNSTSTQRVGGKQHLTTFGYAYVPILSSSSAKNNVNKTSLDLEIYSLVKPSQSYSPLLRKEFQHKSKIHVVYLVEQTDLDILENGAVNNNDYETKVFEKVLKSMGSSYKFIDALKQLPNQVSIPLPFGNFMIALNGISGLSYNVNSMKSLDYLQQLLRIIALSNTSGIEAVNHDADAGSLVYFDDETIDGLTDCIVELVKNTFEDSVLDDFNGIKVPPGFDSYGKISVLNEGFDCVGWSSKWKESCQALSLKSNYEAEDDDTDENGIKSKAAVCESAKEKYQDLLKTLQ